MEKGPKLQAVTDVIDSVEYPDCSRDLMYPNFFAIERSSHACIFTPTEE